MSKSYKLIDKLCLIEINFSLLFRYNNKGIDSNINEIKHPFMGAFTDSYGHSAHWLDTDPAPKYMPKQNLLFI